VANKKSLCSLNCPLHIDCGGYINLIKKQKFYEAAELILQDLPLPESIARICQRNCEKNCVKNLIVFLFEV
jgi:NADPH-dependent glutamate synthase beta subunit-like oxidoreductase